MCLRTTKCISRKSAVVVQVVQVVAVGTVPRRYTFPLPDLKNERIFDRQLMQHAQLSINNINFRPPFNIDRPPTNECRFAVSFMKVICMRQAGELRTKGFTLHMEPQQHSNRTNEGSRFTTWTVVRRNLHGALQQELAAAELLRWGSVDVAGRSPNRICFPCSTEPAADTRTRNQTGTNRHEWTRNGGVDPCG